MTQTTEVGTPLFHQEKSMLKQMREAQGWMIKGVLWAVVAAFLVTIFYSWGVQSGNAPTRSEVATILGRRIGIAEFQQAQNALYQTYRNIFGNRADIDLRERFNFREMALEQLAQRSLLLRMAEQESFQVTNAELYDRIARISAFQENGRFDPARYQAVLRQQVPPIPLKQFEAEQRQALLAEKVYDMVQSSVQVTAAEVQAAYRRQHEQIAARYVTLVPSLFTAQVSITDDEVRAHYESDPERYQKPEQRQIRYVAVSPKRFPFSGEITSDRVTDYYETHPEEFPRQEEVQARHILFKIAGNTDDAQEAAVRAKAEKILTELRDGMDFAALAKEHSEDPASAEQGGDLGRFPRGRMVPPFEAAAFSLPVGALSELVRTQFGFHIIRVDDKIPAGVKAKSEVEEEIKTKLRTEQEEESALAFVDDLMVLLEEDPAQFEPLAMQHGLDVITPPLVPRTGQIAKLEGVSGLVPRVFEVEQGAIHTVEGPDGTHYVFQVADVQPASVKPFEEVQTQAREDLQQQKSQELARQTADDWAAQVQSGTPLNELATSLEVQVVETEPFKRDDPVPQFGRSAAFSKTAFDLAPGDAASVHERDRHVVVQMTRRQAASMDGFEAEQAAVRQRLLAQKRQQTRAAFDNALRAQYLQLRQEGEIVVNPQYVF
jgi:peptidyl-prolyl cis-trans isomerase D